MKKIIRYCPEFYFMGFGIYWAIENYAASGYKNYVALLVVWLMFLQVIYKNRILGIIYGGVFSMSSLFMMLATFTEFREFSGFTSQSVTLITVGIGLFGTGLLMAGGMIYKSLVAKQDYDESVLTVHY